MLKLFAVLALIIPTTAMAQDQLVVASWNIANLASGPGVDLRGHARTEEQYDEIAAVIASMGADVIALQEIGSIPAAERVLGPDYEVWFESRCLQNTARCMADVGDIFTAIAVRKPLAPRVEVFQIDELAIPHQDECAGPARPVRGAVGVKMDLAGRTYWIPSIHLKSSCNRGTTNEADIMDDCATLAKQFDILKTWIEDRPDEDAIILTGDFNRRFLIVPEPKMTSIVPAPEFLPAEDKRQCWANYRFDFRALKDEAMALSPGVYVDGVRPQIYTPRQFGPIDYFVAINAGPNVTLTADMIELDDLNSFGNPASYIEDCDGKPKPFDGGDLLTFGQADPSDHCPIRLVIEGEAEMSINQAE